MGTAATWLPHSCSPHSDRQLSQVSPQVSTQVVPVPEEVLGTDQGQDSVEQLLAWVADMEELVGNQKPASAEVKVAKAQLEEQKVSTSQLAQSTRAGHFRTGGTRAVPGWCGRDRFLGTTPFPLPTAPEAAAGGAEATHGVVPAGQRCASSTWPWHSGARGQQQPLWPQGEVAQAEGGG